jgi:hypothetical protein
MDPIWRKPSVLSFEAFSLRSPLMGTKGPHPSNLTTHGSTRRCRRHCAAEPEKFSSSHARRRRVSAQRLSLLQDHLTSRSRDAPRAHVAVPIEHLRMLIEKRGPERCIASTLTRDVRWNGFVQIIRGLRSSTLRPGWRHSVGLTDVLRTARSLRACRAMTLRKPATIHNIEGLVNRL